MQQVRQPEHFEDRLHRRIKPRIDPCRAITIRPVPRVDLPQFCCELLRRSSLIQGRIAFPIAEDQQVGRVGPCPEIRRILRRIDLRPAFFVAAQTEIVGVPIAGAEFAGALVALSLDAGLAQDLQPFVHVVIRAEHAVPVVLADVEAVLARHPVRLADIHLSRPETTTINEPPPATLAETSPEVLFLAAFRDAHGIDQDGRHLAAFRGALAEV